jgi:hypothetical protein
MDDRLYSFIKYKEKELDKVTYHLPTSGLPDFQRGKEKHLTKTTIP